MTGDDLDQITTPDGAYLLAYDCGCSIKIVHAWVVSTSHCGDPEHDYLGRQGEQ